MTISWDQIESEYLKSFGAVPEAMQAFYDANPEFALGWYTSKKAVIEHHPDGLDRKTKELIFTLIDVMLGHPDGAIIHARAAEAAGLSRTALMEAFQQITLYCGITIYSKTIHPVVAALNEDR